MPDYDTKYCDTCGEQMANTGPPIGGYYCDNDECSKTSEQNLSEAIEKYGQNVSYSSLPSDKNNSLMSHLSFDDVQIVPKKSDVESRDNVDLTSPFTKNHILETPLVASPMESVVGEKMMRAMHRLGGAAILHRFGGEDYEADVIEKMQDLMLKSASVGMSGDYLHRVKSLVTAGADVILVDVAHGHHTMMKDALKQITELFSNVDVIAGNVATGDAAHDLVKWGADAVRVGIGNGSVCTTRMKTGVGVPQISAIQNVKERLEGIEDIYGYIPLIADGGIQYPGDACKALAAGADTVMIGSLFAGTRESPGSVINKGEGKRWPKSDYRMVHTGSASKENGSRYVEGVAREVPFTGSLEEVVESICDGLRSSFSYVGAKDMREFHNRSELIKVTQNGHDEGMPM